MDRLVYAHQSGPSTLEIQGLAPAQVWVTGISDVGVAGTIRNTGSAPVPAGAAAVRFFALSGLDYVSGDTSPKLPALAPGQSVTFLWYVRPTSPDARLSVALSVQEPGRPPKVRVIAIPHLPDLPPLDTAAPAKICRARVNGRDAVLENDRVQLRIVGGNIAVLSCYTRGVWRQIAAVYPLLECVSAETGEAPWCETFQPDIAEAVSGKDAASILLRGSIGTKWRASLQISVRTGSAAIDEHAWLTARKTAQMWSLRFSPIRAGAGSFGMAASEALPCSVSGPNLVSACRWGEITCGIVTQGSAPFPGWRNNALDPIPGVDYRTMGVEWVASGQPATVSRGGSVELRSRLFALQPSFSVQDAMRISLPAVAFVSTNLRRTQARSGAAAGARMVHRE